MHIDSLSVNNYRNYQEFKLDSLQKYNIFIGKNGAGKTNLLEAIDLVISGSSFRNSNNKHLILDDIKNAYIKAIVTDGIRSLVNTVEINNHARLFKINNKKKKRAELLNVLPVVVFTPDDTKLVTHSSSNKRKYLDDLGSKLYKNYLQVRSDYEKIIQYKNKLLLNIASHREIESSNDVLVTCGAKLINYRKTLFDRLLPLLESEYSNFSNKSEETLSASYIPSWDKVKKSINLTQNLTDYQLMKNILREELSNNFYIEKDKKRAVIGPHNDQIDFYINKKNVADFASQGQKRSLLLAIKIVELSYIYKIKEIKPLLLLDDVFSELDQSRKDVFLKMVDKSEQVFITATDIVGLPVDYINKAKVIEIQ